MATVDTLVSKLKDLGGSANNPDLKAALGLKDKEWEVLKRAALSSGKVVPGRGFGGRLSLPEHENAKQAQAARNGASMTITSYSSMAGKKVMLLDKDGKPKGAMATIVEFVPSDNMLLIFVE